jgi:hypothetical protein
LLSCHDESSIIRTNTHGSPLNGSFGGKFGQVPVPFPPNHSNGYYYLNVRADATHGCGIGADGLYHYVLHVTANGVGLAPGCPQSSATGWGPPCDPSFRRVSGAALANESPAWGFETKNDDRTSTLKCTGGDASGGYPSLCPGSPNVVASPGDATVEWRYDGPEGAISQRIDNQNDEPIWETATLDVVSCSTCELAGAQRVTIAGGGVPPFS